MVEALVEQVGWLTPTSLFVLLNIVIATILVSTAFHAHPKKPHQANHSHHDSSFHSTPLPAQTLPPLARAPSLFARITSFKLSNYYPCNTGTVTSTERYHHDDVGEQQHQNQYQQQQHQQPSPSSSFFSHVASFKFSDWTADELPDPKPERQGYKEPEPELVVKSSMKRDNNYNSNTNKVINRVQHVGPAAAVKRAVPRAPSLLSRVTSFSFSGVGRDPQKDAIVEARERHVRRDEQEKVVGDKLKKPMAKKENKTKSLPRETASLKVDEEVDNKADDFISRFKQQLKLQRIESLIRQRSA